MCLLATPSCKLISEPFAPKWCDSLRKQDGCVNSTCDSLHLKELGTAHVEEEVRKVGKAGRPPEAGWVIFGILTKLGGYPDQHSVQPSQDIKDILLTAPAGVAAAASVETCSTPQASFARSLHYLLAVMLKLRTFMSYAVLRRQIS